MSRSVSHHRVAMIRAKASAARRLGLWLARRMGGDITAESPVGRDPTLTVEAAAAPPPAPQVAAVRVLVAEDNETDRLVLRTVLDQLGVQLGMTADGEEAVEAWRYGGFDLILMDVQMPVMDGLTATRRIRAIEAETGRPRTPIIALTANAMSHHLAEYAEAGMDGVAAKPIQLSRLVEQMNVALTGTRSGMIGRGSAAA